MRDLDRQAELLTSSKILKSKGQKKYYLLSLFVPATLLSILNNRRFCATSFWRKIELHIEFHSHFLRQKFPIFSKIKIEKNFHPSLT